MDLNLPKKSVFLGPASLWKRGLAFVIDLFVLDFFVMSMFGSVTGKVLGETSDVLAAYSLIQENTSQMNALMMMFSIIVMLILAYFVLLQYAAGQTLGATLLNIHVVEQVNEKQFARPGFWRCVLRNIFIIPAVPFVFLWIIDPAYLIFAKKGQRLTEWLSGTRVVERFEL
jgi:uncharacterized RDD family membrane protein YckC